MSRKITFTPVGGTEQEVEIGINSMLLITLDSADIEHSVKLADPVADDVVDFVGSRDKNKRD